MADSRKSPPLPIDSSRIGNPSQRYRRITTQTSATLVAALIGLGFGMAFISQAATFAHFFGRHAFATTTGVRFMFGAVFSAPIPALAGWVFDTRGTYAPAFIGLAVLSLAGSLIAYVIQAPKRATP